MSTAPLTADKPLNFRQEKFCQAVCRGMSHAAAAREAGYKGTAAWQPLRMPNVQRRIAQLTAQAAERNAITIDAITQRLLAIIERNEAGDTVSSQSLARQALMDLAKLHGLLTGKSMMNAPPKPAPEPITEIRRIIVYPDGRKTDYDDNPVD